MHQPADDGACKCPDCGKGMAKLGEDITEVLDYVPGHFEVIRHVRPKYACTACDAITQAPAPAMPTPRGRAPPATLAHLLVAKYCDHLPLYRQSEIYAREGLELDRSTLGDWVGQYSATARMAGQRQQGWPVAACWEDDVADAARQVLCRGAAEFVGMSRGSEVALCAGGQD